MTAPEIDPDQYHVTIKRGDALIAELRGYAGHDLRRAVMKALVGGRINWTTERVDKLAYYHGMQLRPAAIARLLRAECAIDNLSTGAVCIQIAKRYAAGDERFKRPERSEAQKAQDAALSKHPGARSRRRKAVLVLASSPAFAAAMGEENDNTA